MLSVLLIGGKSSRFGSDKALIPWKGMPAYLYLAEQYSSLGSVAFCVDQHGRFPCGPFQELIDPFPGQGPLNGILAAFSQTNEDLIFLTATDLLCGNPLLVQHLLGQIGEADGCAIQRTNGRIEPLFSLYRRSCVSAAEEVIRAGNRSFVRMMDRVRMRIVQEKELPSQLVCQSLKNINTTEDYHHLLTESEPKFE